MDDIIIVFGLSFLQTLAIVAGGILLALTKKYDTKKEVFSLGFAAAAMIGIAFFDLIFEANILIREIGDCKWIIGVGFLLGLFFMIFLDYILPHEQTRGAGARTSIRSLYSKPKMIKKFKTKDAIKDPINRNIIKELRFLAPTFKSLYIEILNHERITLQELKQNLNIDDAELNEYKTYLVQHNYIKEVFEEGEKYYCVSLENTVNKRNIEELRNIGWKSVLGFSLHDFPEGLTIGCGFGANPSLGILIAISLFVHNVTEGVTIASNFKSSGAKAKDIVKICLIPGLLVILGAMIGYAISIFLSSTVLALLLSFSAGMFVFIALHDLLPQAIGLEEEAVMTISMVFGFSIACLLFAI